MCGNFVDSEKLLMDVEFEQAKLARGNSLLFQSQPELAAAAGDLELLWQDPDNALALSLAFWRPSPGAAADGSAQTSSAPAATSAVRAGRQRRIGGLVGAPQNRRLATCRTLEARLRLPGQLLVIPLKEDRRALAHRVRAVAGGVIHEQE